MVFEVDEFIHVGMGSGVVARRFSCPEVCGIFLDQGSNPCPCIDRQILYHWALREVLYLLFNSTKHYVVEQNVSLYADW